MVQHSKDGGPAFPQFDLKSGDRDGHGDLIDPFTTSAGGMSLRDWFASRAMQGIVGSIGSEDAYLRLRCHAQSEDLTVSQWIARDAYKQADAMLAERSKPEGRS